MIQRRRRAAPLPVGFFRRDAHEVARDLLGRILVSHIGGTLTAGRIVEVGAYLGGTDPASHAYGFRRSARNAALYGPAGSWYVYRSYGLHWCANLVTDPPEEGAAVLLRALEPLEGLARMRRRRGGREARVLCAGPGRLTAALGIDRRLNGARVRGSGLDLRAGDPLPSARVAVTPRIGLTRAADWPLRFVEADSSWLSRAPRR